jgi:ubiquinone/menaquinone biosynthesis C-methylase UbiE
MNETKRQTTQQIRQKGDLGHMAGYYDLIMVFLTLGRENKLRKKTLDMAQIKPGEKVLEVGCGTGTLTIAAGARTGTSGEAAGIDIAPEMIKAAKRKAKKRGANITFQVSSIEHIPYPDKRFEVVLGSFMIFHMPEETRIKGLAEIFRVLKTGGRLFIIDMVDLSELEPILKELCFTNIEINKFKLHFMTLWTLRGTARKP